jgi:hypothetical protein
MTTQAMTPAMSGQFTVCVTDKPMHDAAVEIGTEMAAGGEAVLVLDIAACLDPARMSQAGPDITRLLHVMRVTAPEGLDDAWNTVRAAQERLPFRRLLIVGILNHLYDPRIVTREAARALGRIKAKLEEFAEIGMDVTVLCETNSAGLGTRAHFLPSLCAAAHHLRSRT